MLLMAMWVPAMASAMTIKSAGSLSVAPNSSIIAIATDPTIQETLSEDFSSQRHGVSKPGPELTLTVTLVSRQLTPDLSPDAVAPGVRATAALLRAAGWVPLTDAAAAGPAAQEPVSKSIQEYMSQGNGLMGNGMITQGPPTTVQQIYQLSNPPDSSGGISELPRYVGSQIYKPDSSDQQQTYNTALVAHAVLGNGAGDFTVLAVVPPGGDFEAAKKLIAERIANAVLH
jgi:hypothetical protein